MPKSPSEKVKTFYGLHKWPKIDSTGLGIEEVVEIIATLQVDRGVSLDFTCEETRLFYRWFLTVCRHTGRHRARLGMRAPKGAIEWASAMGLMVNNDLAVFSQGNFRWGF